LEDFASDNEEEEVSSNEEPTPRPTSPMTRWREWLSGHNEGLPQPGIGRQAAHEMLGWQHFWETRGQGKRCLDPCEMPGQLCEMPKQQDQGSCE